MLDDKSWLSIASFYRDRIQATIFVNTLVLRSDLRGNPSFRELLVRIRDRAVQAFAHQELPFEKLVEELQPERDLSRNPICQVFFQLADEPSADLIAPNGSCRANDLSPRFWWASPPLSGESSKFDLNLSLWNGRSGVGGRLEYSSDLFERKTAARMADHFQVLLEGLVGNPGDPISTTPILTAGERQELDGFNATAALIPDVCVHELIDEQAARTPHARAVGGLSYRDLVRLANGLSHHLIARGARSNKLVGVMLPRGPDRSFWISGALSWQVYRCSTWRQTARGRCLPVSGVAVYRCASLWP